MGTKIKTWQIENGILKSINSKLQDNGRTEPYDLEPWIKSNPEILDSDIAIICHQISSKSGPIGLLAHLFEFYGQMLKISLIFSSVRLSFCI